MSNVGSIDEKALATLKEIGGDDFLRQMIDAFLQYTTRVIGEAREGLATGNLEPVTRMGHSLHSGARSLGAMRIMELGGRIEAAGHERRLEDLARLLLEMEVAFEAAKAELEATKEELSDQRAHHE